MVIDRWFQLYCPRNRRGDIPREGNSAIRALLHIDVQNSFFSRSIRICVRGPGQLVCVRPEPLVKESQCPLLLLYW